MKRKKILFLLHFCSLWKLSHSDTTLKLKHIFHTKAHLQNNVCVDRYQCHTTPLMDICPTEQT